MNLIAIERTHFAVCVVVVVFSSRISCAIIFKIELQQRIFVSVVCDWYS